MRTEVAASNVAEVLYVTGQGNGDTLPNGLLRRRVGYMQC